MCPPPGNGCLSPFSMSTFPLDSHRDRAIYFPERSKGRAVTVHLRNVSIIVQMPVLVIYDGRMGTNAPVT